MIVAVCALVATILIFDQFSKFLILKYIGLNTTYVIIKGVLSITPTLNTGGGFGILPNQTLLFILISLLTIIFLALILGDTLQHKKDTQPGRGHSAAQKKFWNIHTLFCAAGCPPCSRVSPHAISLILAGALGNLIDRLRLGAVIDFIDFKIWPVFNIADTSITIGAIMLAWCLWKNLK